MKCVRKREKARERESVRDVEIEAKRIMTTVRYLTVSTLSRFYNRTPDFNFTTQRVLCVHVFLTVRLQGARSLLGECRTNPVWLLKPRFIPSATKVGP